jgi:hypothetical protein
MKTVGPFQKVMTYGLRFIGGELNTDIVKVDGSREGPANTPSARTVLQPKKLVSAI